MVVHNWLSRLSCHVSRLTFIHTHTRTHKTRHPSSSQDCELTDLRPYEAFYGKQMVFTFIVPSIVVACLLSWGLIWCLCARRMRLTRARVKNYTITSIVLLVFLCYPLLVRLCLSMLKCPIVGDKMYLMADLQEECFGSRHTMYLCLLTLPQFILCVVGLPLSAGLLMVRTKHPRRWAKLEEAARHDFKMRYGLLYLGCECACVRRERGPPPVVL